MELDQISTKDPDKSMSDPEPLTQEHPGSLVVAPQVEPILPSLILVPLKSLEHGTAGLVSEDEEYISPTPRQPELNMPY